MFASRLKFFMLAVLIAGVFGCVWAFAVKAETTYYRYATWQCQDGTTTRQGSSTTCKSSDEWNTTAETACARLCNRSGKCGVAQFSVSTECRLTEVVAPTAPVVTPKPTCRDTDGGSYVFTKGTLSVYTPANGNQTVVEVCADDKTMDELVCLTDDPTYAYTHERTACRYGCRDGACIATAPVVIIPVVRYDASAKSTFMAPSDGAILTNYPREAELQWTPITSASKYEIGVEISWSTGWETVDSLTSRSVYVVTPALTGDNQFRARVRAVYPDGTFSQWSDYLYFSYKTAPTLTTPPTPNPVETQPTIVEPATSQPASIKTGVQTTEQTPEEVVAEETPIVVESKPTVAPKVAEKKVGRMFCGNSAGGDGLYSACVKDTIKLDNKINITVRTYSGNYAWLIVKGAKKAYYRVKLGDSVDVVSKNDKDIISVTYVKKSPKFGVFLQIETAE